MVNKDWKWASQGAWSGFTHPAAGLFHAVAPRQKAGGGAFVAGRAPDSRISSQ
jgi:hypothetical protein